MQPFPPTVRSFTRSYHRALPAALAAAFLVAALLSRPISAAAEDQANPTSKVFFADVQGNDAFVYRGDRSQQVTAKETYEASGLAIETKSGAAVTMVFSSGLGVQLRADTRIAVKRFVQEPFRPDRTDLAIEPSISDVELELVHGEAVFSTGQLAPGSRLNVQTSRAVLNIQGGTLLVTANSETTNVSMLAGSCTVYVRNDSPRAYTAKEGEMVTVRLGQPGESGGSVIIVATRMTDAQFAVLTDQAANTVLMKRTVYFEQKTAANAFALVTALDPPETKGSAPQRKVLELVALPVVPADLPVQFTVSPAALISSTGH